MKNNERILLKARCNPYFHPHPPGHPISVTETKKGKAAYWPHSYSISVNSMAGHPYIINFPFPKLFGRHISVQLMQQYYQEHLLALKEYWEH